MSDAQKGIDAIKIVDGEYILPPDVYLDDFYKLPEGDVLIFGDPGIGKSVWATNVLRENKKAYLLMNTIPNLEQIQFANKDVASRIIQFEHIYQAADADILIIDEIDILYNSFFRGKYILAVYEFLRLNPQIQIIGMTGTLIEEFLIPELDIVRIRKPHGRALEVIQINTKGAVFTVNNATHYTKQIAEHYPDKNIILFASSDVKGNEIASKLNKDGIKTVYISRSSIALDSEIAKVYRKVTTEGLDAVDYQVFIVTSFFNAGLSLGNCITITFDNVPEIIVQQHNRQRGVLVDGVMEYAPSFHICGNQLDHDIITKVVKAEDIKGDMTSFLMNSNLISVAGFDLSNFNLSDAKHLGYMAVADAYEEIAKAARKNYISGGILKRIQQRYGFELQPIVVDEPDAVADKSIKTKMTILKYAKDNNVAFTGLSKQTLMELNISPAAYTSLIEKYRMMHKLFFGTCLSTKTFDIFRVASNDFINSMCVLSQQQLGNVKKFQTELFKHKEIEGTLDVTGIKELSKEFWGNFLPFESTPSHDKIYKNYISKVKKEYKEPKVNANKVGLNRVNALKKSVEKKGIVFSESEALAKMTVSREQIGKMTKEEWKNARTNYIQEL